MKQILILIFAFLVSGFVMGQNLVNESATDISVKMATALNEDLLFSLNTYQKDSLLSAAKKYADKLVLAREMTNKEAAALLMRSEMENYEQALDRFLTTEQKELLKKKREEKIQKMISTSKNAK